VKKVSAHGRRTPEYWLYPLQVLIPAALLYHWRPFYQSSPPRRVSWSAAIGLIALGVWISPQLLLHRPPRLEGFDPGHFGPGLPYALNLTLRLARSIVVVPFVEELFWRGFLLRFVVDPDFTKVPVGAYTRWSFWIVTLGFVLEHGTVDWPAAALTGMLYNLVAFRTGSLGSCIIAHAVTNAALAGYILYTGQFGFW
jgi:CAAX prenyl protease-like protein